MTSVQVCAHTIFQVLELQVNEHPHETDWQDLPVTTHRPHYKYYLSWLCRFYRPSPYIWYPQLEHRIELRDVKIKWLNRPDAASFPGQGQDWVAIAIPTLYLDLFEHKVPQYFRFIPRFRYVLYEAVIDDESHVVCRIYINCERRFTEFLYDGYDEIDEIRRPNSRFLKSRLPRRWEPVKLTVQMGLKYRGRWIQERQYKSAKVVLGLDACAIDFDSY